LLEQHGAGFAVALATALKDLCADAWYSEPAQASEGAALLRILAARSEEQEVHALAAWGNAIAALAEAQMDQALEAFDAAATQFGLLHQPQTVASVQVGKLTALAMLGRYDEAVACGLAARDVLLAHGDAARAGRVEANLGNIAWRRDRYAEAEGYYRVARARYLEAGEVAPLARLELSLAEVLARRNQFSAARELNEQALRRAEQAGLAVVQAEAECNLGNLAMAQGCYDEALAFLERSRRRYAQLGMPHESAYADLELAEAYLELNLVPEAATILVRVIALFAELGMRSEQAWALAHYGQAALLLGDAERAQQHFTEARQLFATEGNTVSVALIALFEAQLHYRAQHYPEAARLAADAEAAFRAAGFGRRQSVAAWVRGEALRAQGELLAARRLLEETLRTAEVNATPQIAQRCATSLGLLAAAQDDLATAETYFLRAVAIVEQMRAPLPAEEFRTAFLSDKLSPFAELARICLATGRGAEALAFIERARSRALVEMLGDTTAAQRRPYDAFEAALLDRLKELRSELNWYYQRISRLEESQGNAAGGLPKLQVEALERETALLELTRQIEQQGGALPAVSAPFDLEALRPQLGEATALVVYYSLDDELLAIVVTTDAIQVVRRLGSEQALTRLVDHLRFQTNTMRGAAGRKPAHQAQLLRRAQHYLAALYDALLRPLTPLLGTRRLVVVPHRALHYVPFRALFDGERYVIEELEVCTVPSAAVLLHCLRQPKANSKRAVLLGVPDARAPKVRDEVLTIAPLWPERVTLLDDEATLAALQQHAPTAGVLHLACHGQFRADSPLFSALQLADDRLTVRDAYRLELSCDLVVLSACETGVSAIAPGDELIGLARGFFAAGAPSLVVSLWTVDDATTAKLMQTFYAALQAGERSSAALRQAQLALMQHHPHPFYWAPFVLMGRW
jgi:CHAT domain-containing protein/tetratricopeptide (TPR) repeat protein